jgi:hypothetical protein
MVNKSNKTGTNNGQKSAPSHEDASMHAFMVAPFSEQIPQLRAWGEPPAGLLILMSACEGQCFFCAQPVVTNPPLKMVTKWSDISNKLIGNQSIGQKQLLIGGTEPPTHPSFERTLLLAMESGFESIQLMTSGLQLAHKGTGWWSMGVRSVCTPMYSHLPETHDSIVGVPGHWAKVVEGLDAAVQLGMDVFVHTLAMSRTLGHVSTLAKWVHERWGNPLALAPMRPKEELFSFSDESPSLAEVRAIHTDDLAFVGFPLCVGDPGKSALLTRLYFRSQRRAFGTPCTNCDVRSRCSGVVLGTLAQFGEKDLHPVMPTSDLFNTPPNRR